MLHVVGMRQLQYVGKPLPKSSEHGLLDCCMKLSSLITAPSDCGFNVHEEIEMSCCGINVMRNLRFHAVGIANRSFQLSWGHMCHWFWTPLVLF